MQKIQGFQVHPGINRNILECKVENMPQELQLLERINRNILECKDHKQ